MKRIAQDRREFGWERISRVFRSRTDLRDHRGYFGGQPFGFNHIIKGRAVGNGVFNLGDEIGEQPVSF